MQPVQVGFSYDVPTNGSMDLTNGNMTAPAAPLPSNRPPGLFLNGTFSSLNANNTANTTETAAYAVWHMLQGFLGAFPQYNAPATTLNVNLFAESYGGKYGPVFADVWDQQNRIRKNSSMSNSTMDVRLASLGIVNGCVDDLIQVPYYPAMAVNNTYGLQSISSVRAALANASFYAPGGCQDAINQCRLATSYYDPNNTGSVSGPNILCQTAYNTCTSNVMDPYGDSGRSFYDIGHQLPESFPPSTYIDYLNTQPILNAIGSVVNYTDFSNTVWSDLMSTGDWERGPIVPKLAALLDRGVRVGFMYGDRDYICNWLGGEAVSLNVAATEGGAYATNFPTAGYAPIIVNNSYIGGAVRQYGNLSFSRIYQAGHFVPAYQPETAFQVFARIVMGTSVSTGMPVDLSTYNTTGPLNATSSMSLPASPTATCYLRAIESSCTQDQIAAILRDEGVFINGVWYSALSDWPGATSTTSASSQTATPTTSATTLTGLFTATSTPTNAAVARIPRTVSSWFYLIMAYWLVHA
jgi:carboxypeptidase C (cathepsin A)